MALRSAFWLLCGLVLLGAGMGPARAQTECPYLTRPLVEIENGATRINQWEHGTLLCYRGRMLRCEVGTWADYGDCPQGLDWQARDAVIQEQNAHPQGVTTPAPAPPAPTSPATTVLPAPPTMSQPAPAVVPEGPAAPSTTPSAPGLPAATTEKIETPPKAQAPAAEGAPPPAASSSEPPPIDCSDMQRLSFERVFNKSLVESQRCQAACTTEDCKHECENQHDNVRAPQIMERFHSDACSSIWYP